MKLIALTALIVCSAQLSAVAAPATYAIKFNRPFKVGTKFDLNSVSNVKRVRTIDGVSDMNDQNKVILHGLAEVIEIDDKGRPKKVKVKVAECTANGKVIVSPGMEMLAERGAKGRAQFLVGGSFLSTEKSQLLAGAVPLSHGTEPTDDDVFGTTKRQPIGGSWPANGPLAGAMFERILNQSVSVKGSCKLESVKKVNGIDCLIITGTMNGGGSMQMVSRMTGAFPIDPKLPRQTESSSMRFSLAGPRVSVVVENSQTSTYNFDVKEPAAPTPAQEATSAGDAASPSSEVPVTTTDAPPAPADLQNSK